MNLKLMRDAWCKFWFAPQSPIPIAIFRILFGLLLLQTTFHWTMDWPLYYGADPLVPVEDTVMAVWNQNGQGPRIDLFVLFPTSIIWRYFIWGAHTLAVFGIIFGLFTRLSFFVSWICFLTFITHFHYHYNAGDRYESIMLFLMFFSNAGDALSIDALVKNWHIDWRKAGFAAPMKSGWLMRMIQVQLSVAYCHSTFAKLSGQMWLDGSIIYYCTRFEDFSRIYFPGCDTMWMCKILSWGTLLVEGSMAFLVWVKELRYWVLLAGIGLHLGIELTMNIPVFEGLYMATYILFVDPKDLAKVMERMRSWVKQYAGPPLQLAFDGNWERCIQITGVIHRLDVFHLIEFIDFRAPENSSRLKGLLLESADKDLFVRHKGGWLRTKDSAGLIFGRLPLLWLLQIVPGLGGALGSWINAKSPEPTSMMQGTVSPEKS